MDIASAAWRTVHFFHYRRHCPVPNTATLPLLCYLPPYATLPRAGGRTALINRDGAGDASMVAFITPCGGGRHGEVSCVADRMYRMTRTFVHARGDAYLACQPGLPDLRWTVVLAADCLPASPAITYHRCHSMALTPYQRYRGCAMPPPAHRLCRRATTPPPHSIA